MVGLAVVAHMPSMPLRRKKWTEEEEETLISKYGELLQSGCLSKMKSRERKFEPIAAHVNALYHARNPVAYPWHWTWKDTSTKVQNMRHQYLGVKQKIRNIVVEPGEHEEYDWEDGLSHWSNFLKYKEVFGDQELDVNDFFSHPNPKVLAPRLYRSCGAGIQQQQSVTAYRNGIGISSSHAKDFVDNSVGIVNQSGAMLLPAVKDHALSSGVDQVVLDGGEPGDLAVGLGSFGDYDDTDEQGLKDGDDDYEEDDGNAIECHRRKRRKQWLKPFVGFESNSGESQIVAFIASQFSDVRERELRREKQELEREKERERRLSLLEAEIMRTQQEWEKEKKKIEEMRQRDSESRDVKWQERELKRDELEQQRGEIERERDRARDEKMERDRMEWQEKMETQTIQHQAAMMQIQLQIAQIHQNSMTMLTGALLQLAGQSNELTGQGSSVAPFVPQFLQSLQTHGNGGVQCGIRRGNGESSDNQFDVDE